MLRTIAAAVLASAVLAGCGARNDPAPRATPGGTPNAAPSVVMIIRHGEKPDGSHPGVDATGNEDSGSLTATGWERAHRLVGPFDPAPGRSRPGLSRPTAIYAAGANGKGDGARTRETVAPLADELGIPVDTRYDVVWTVTRTADGWRFAQTPELALPGDRAAVIGN